jgi:hypothetical protein
MLHPIEYFTPLSVGKTAGVHREPGEIMDGSRRLRGLIGTAATWAVVWSAVGVIPSVAIQAFWFGRHGDAPLSAAAILPMIGWGLAIWAVWGALSGLVFGTVVAIRERHRTAGDLTVRRIGTWGLIAGLTIPALVLAYVLTHSPAQAISPGMGKLLLFGALLGSGCGAGSLVLARRGQVRRSR